MSSRLLIVRATILAMLAGALLVPGVSAFQLEGCSLRLASIDADGQELDTATGDDAGGDGGTIDDPLLVDYQGTIRWEGETGGSPITNATWSVDVFRIPTFVRGSDPNEEGETDRFGEVDVSASLPFRITGLYFVSGELTGEGGSCRGGLWIRVLGDADTTVTTPPFWVALLLIAAGIATVWSARPTAVVAPGAPAGVVAVRRHPVLGAVGGGLIGLGVALLLIMFGAAVVAELTIVALALAFGVIGLVAALVLPPRSPMVVA